MKNGTVAPPCVKFHNQIPSAVIVILLQYITAIALPNRSYFGVPIRISLNYMSYVHDVLHFTSLPM